MAQMAYLNTRIPEELKNNLISISNILEIKKADIVRKALKNYLLDLQEDIEDVRDAEEILAQNNISEDWEDVKKELGLMDEVDN